MASNDEQAGSSSEGRDPRGSTPAPHVNGSYANGGPILLDLEFVRQLIQAVDTSGIDTLEITRAGTRIRISKTPTPVALPIAAPAAAAAAGPAASSSPAASGHASPAAAPSEPSPQAPARNLVEVKSPMVGTFYRAPAPEAPPYVEVGTAVTQKQTLCILEAMKLMNELESEVDGIVREILVENADPVEYGQVLFRIEPTKPA
jgi:acetyl-CoA carboxylase biotin carboxyl carrier protein